jgi:L-ascorbate metabolism protein UlaG (beta-lactamase superfamily)
MNITKYEHACLVIDDHGQKILIDPGAFGGVPTGLNKLVAVIYTHGHFDHYTKENHDKLITSHPDVKTYATPEIAGDIPNCVVPQVGMEYKSGPFKLSFYGEFHADKNPPEPNLGVIINDTVAYPGDSLDEAGQKIKVLLAPANGPWMRVTETMALIEKTKASIVIPTHDALLSVAGNKVADMYLSNATEQAGGTYHRLQIGESIEV